MNFISQYKGLPRSVYILALARCINGIGFFVFPFMTLFMSVRLGLNEVEIGRYLLIISCMFLPASALAGKLADILPRKKLYVTAQLLANSAIFICGFLGNSMWVIYLCIFAEFFYGMMYPINSAMTMDLTTPQNRMESMSLIYLAMNLGVAIGPFFAGILFDRYTAWLFWGDGLTGFVAMLIILFFVPDTTPDKEHITKINMDQSRQLESSESGSVFTALLKRPVLLAFILIDIFLAFSYAQTGYLVPLHVKDLFDVATGAKYYGYLMALNGLVVVLFTAPLVFLTKKIRTMVNIVLASVLFALGFGLYAFVLSLPGLLLCTFLWTIGEVLSATNVGVYIANHTPVTHRARFQSLIDILSGTGRAIGPLLVGYYLVAHTIPQAWLLIGGICAFSAVAYVFLDFIDRKVSRHEETTRTDPQAF